MITLFSQPGCGPCVYARRAFESKGVEFTVVDIRKDPGAAQQLIELGGQSTPYLLNDETGWSGPFDPQNPLACLEGASEVVAHAG